jgi:Ca2+/Na+ antiporter
MNLKDAWKKLELDKLEVAKPSVINPWATKSQHPVEKLKRAYLYSTIFSIIFLLCFIFLLFLFDEWIVRLGLAVTIVIYILFIYFNFKMYREIKIDVLFDSNLRVALKDTHQFITANIRFQERFALFVYPFAGAAGMLVGLASGGGSAEKYLNEKIVIILLILVPLALTPLCWFFARWLYKISYGVCLAELKKLIDEIDR